MHYVDEGPASGEVVLLLHGEPSWSFLYRKMIPVLTRMGLRAVALDLIGFGRSDKPASRDDYTYHAHVNWTRAAIETIGLRDITLVCQDWGGLIGLRLVGEHPELFARVVAANTFLPTGDRHPGEAFLAWRRYSQETPEFKTGQIVNGGCLSSLSDAEVAAYDAPFPTIATSRAPASFRRWSPLPPTILPRRITEPRGILGPLSAPIPVCVFGLRPDYRRCRLSPARAYPRGGRSPSGYDRRRRPLPARRQRQRIGRGSGPVRAQHTSPAVTLRTRGRCASGKAYPNWGIPARPLSGSHARCEPFHQQKSPRILPSQQIRVQSPANRSASSLGCSKTRALVARLGSQPPHEISDCGRIWSGLSY